MGRVKKTILTGVIAALLIAVIVVSVAAAIVYGRIADAPLSTTLLNDVIERSIETNLAPGFQAHIQSVTLAREREKGLVLAAIKGLKIGPADTQPVIEVPKIDLAFQRKNIRKLSFTPSFVSVRGGSLRVIRNSQQAIELIALFDSGERAAWSPKPGAAIINRMLSRVEFSDTTIEFSDVLSEKSWVTNDGYAVLTQSSDGLNVNGRASIPLDSETASFDLSAEYVNDSGVVSIVANAAHVPLGDILSMFYGENAAVIDAPVSGRASLAFSRSGVVLSSNIKAQIDKPGFLNVGNRSFPMKTLRWESNFDPSIDQFLIESLIYDIADNAGTISGSVKVETSDTESDGFSVVFDLDGEDLIAHAPGFLASSLPIETLNVAGVFDAKRSALAVSDFSLDLLEVSVVGNGEYRPGETDGVTIKTDVSIDGELDPQDLLKIWPLTAASGARDWIEQRLPEAKIENVVGKLRIYPDSISPDGKLADEALALTFDVSKASAFYAETMPPLTGASGTGLVRGNSFSLWADKGRVNNIEISEGEIEFPEFVPKWGPTYFRFTATGRSEDILAVLDHEPLLLLEKINLSPDQFKGDATAQVQITRPNKRRVDPEEYAYEGVAEFQKMTVSNLVGDVDILNTKGTVTLAPRSVTVSAEGAFADAPIKATWVQNFYKVDGPSSIEMSGRIDAAAADLFGISLRQFARGAIDMRVNATGEIGEFEEIEVFADLSQTELSLDTVGYSKPANVEAVCVLDLKLDRDRFLVESMDIRGKDLSVVGSFALDHSGLLLSANFSQFHLADSINLSMIAERSTTGPLEITAIGDHINAAPAIQSVFKGAAQSNAGANKEGWGAGIRLNARIDEMRLREGVTHANTSFDLWLDKEKVQTLAYSASDIEGAPVTVELVQNSQSDDDARIIKAQSGDLGRLLLGIFGFGAVEGGRGELEILWPRDNEKALSGTLSAWDLIIVDAPLVARIFAAGSLNGLNDLLNGEGIDLSSAWGAFSFKEGVISIPEARVVGPSIGMSAEGAANLSDGGRINLTGAIAPLYSVNSALGAAPVIGDILVGKKGEGVFAVAYSVTGQTGSPTIRVNPLSALTPGIFRNLFQPEQTDPVVPEIKKQDGNKQRESDAPPLDN
ncbi:MAG: AsmA-like C-terminal domain-containing protein [Pseudomonadota bacterium]